MHQLLKRKPANFIQFWKFEKYDKCAYATKSAGTAAAVEKKDRKIKQEAVLNAALSMPNEQHVSTADSRASDASLLSQLTSLSVDGPIDNRSLNLPIIKDISASLALEDQPQPFEDVPGPAFLKFWDKYWKYVPLFGTQLIRSVLINRLAEGRLQWNRNITPINYLFNQYGPVVRLKGPFSGDVVLIHRPEHVRKIFSEEDDTPTRSAIDILQHYRINYRKTLFDGPYCSQGSQGIQWIKIKGSLELPIREQINKQHVKFSITCEELLQRIRQTRNRQDEVPGNFSQDLLRWGMECFWILMLNKKLGYLDPTSYNETAEATRFIEALTKAHHYMSRCESGFQIWRFINTPSSKKLYSSCDVIERIIGKYIRIFESSIGREESPNYKEDEQIQSAIFENILLDQSMNAEDLSTLLTDMIILGVQATTNSQAFLLYYLAKNQRAQGKLLNEIITNEKEDPMFSKNTLDNMCYLQACIKESMRMRPSFPYLTRLLSKDTVLHSYKIPKGTYVIMANEISCQREENFEDPEKFKPERWFDKDDFHCTYSYLPFGKGLRSCIGENIAKYQMMLLTTKIIRDFKIEYEYGEINSQFWMMNVPDRPLRFRFVERE